MLPSVSSWLILLVVTPVRGRDETASEPVISVDPPWASFLRGETVTLVCSGSGLRHKTKWYRDRKILIEIQGYTLEVRTSGEYQCQANDLHLSPPVRIDFYEGPLVLQTPPAIFEGDSVVLRCHTKKPETLTFYKDGIALKSSKPPSTLFIHHAQLRNNSEYYCRNERFYSSSSNKVKVKVQELFPQPVLAARPSQPIDGSPVTLICQTRLPPQRSNVQLQFCFFRNSRALESSCSSSSELHIPAIWTEDSTGYYQCTAERRNTQVRKHSPAANIFVQRSLADLQVHTVPASTSVFEGQLLLFNCSVKGVPGPIKLSWYKMDKLNKEAKILKSSEAEFTISTVSSSDSGDYYCEAKNSRRSFVSKTVPITIKVPVSQPVLTLSTGKTRALEGDLITLHCKSQRGSPRIQYKFYYEDVFLEINSTLTGGGASFHFSVTTERSGNYSCTADNGLGPQRSEAVWISVIVPVSRPVLTLGVPAAQVVVGDVVELQCEAPGGSPPILYRFYHHNVTLGSISAPSGGRGSFNFSATAEHFGNFFCEADNGQGPQRSNTLTLSVTDRTENRSVPVAAGITGGLLIMAGAAAGVLFYYRFSRKAGGKPAFDDSRSPSCSERQEPTYSNVPAYIELQPVYGNDPKEDVIYTEVRSNQQKCKRTVEKSESPRPRCQMAE